MKQVPSFRMVWVAAIVVIIALSGCAHSTGPGGGSDGGSLVPGSFFYWEIESQSFDPEDGSIAKDTSTEIRELTAINAYAYGRYNCFGFSNYYGGVTYDTMWYQRAPGGDLSEYQEGTPYVWFTYPFGTGRPIVFTWDTTAFYRGQFISEHVVQTTDYIGSGILVTDSAVLDVQKVRVLLAAKLVEGTQTETVFDTVFASYSPMLGMIVETEEGSSADYIEQGKPDHDAYHRIQKLTYYELKK